MGGKGKGKAGQARDGAGEVLNAVEPDTRAMHVASISNTLVLKPITLLCFGILELTLGGFPNFFSALLPCLLVPLGFVTPKFLC